MPHPSHGGIVTLPVCLIKVDCKLLLRTASHNGVSILAGASKRYRNSSKNKCKEEFSLLGGTTPHSLEGASDQQMALGTLGPDSELPCPALRQASFPASSFERVAVWLKQVETHTWKALASGCMQLPKGTALRAGTSVPS